MRRSGRMSFLSRIQCGMNSSRNPRAWDGEASTEWIPAYAGMTGSGIVKHRDTSSTLDRDHLYQGLREIERRRRESPIGKPYVFSF